MGSVENVYENAVDKDFKVVFKPSRKKKHSYIDKLETTHYTLNNFHYYHSSKFSKCLSLNLDAVLKRKGYGRVIPKSNK
jgi:hypothetical protein